MVSPDHGVFGIVASISRCRFYPSCSAYAIHAIRQYGLLKGSVASFKRVLRCNPFNPGGYDPP
ncbi:MAG: membrane protein insertion efficiency factor YidD [Candidatus Sungbacteria bacterium RIFCSPHIGHO2_02_FULL_47_11]|uniref:Membrane protein insertion efficiency factor YidD n=1 Tax=Candidatus Sungbacteria bacterium RIFCSPHIGHO2_02_FULL_47_11 TaxID=1802270 RepID=A0A1G2KHB3_9BACT|nr:MAG: membrane protein insertion efficiency factor YidD [Candidatus Sungbacteria bacterium RIFCSPHIGHO2_02_FULL_47_11]